MNKNINKVDEDLGNGIHVMIDGETLTLTVKLSYPGTPSASGKTLVNASTRGNVQIPGANGLTIGLNVYTKRP
jgi:hypothetical protein